MERKKRQRRAATFVLSSSFHGHTQGWRPSGWLALIFAGRSWTSLRSEAEIETNIGSLFEQIKGVAPGVFTPRGPVLKTRGPVLTPRGPVLTPGATPRVLGGTTVGGQEAEPGASARVSTATASIDVLLQSTAESANADGKASRGRVHHPLPRALPSHMTTTAPW